MFTLKDIELLETLFQNGRLTEFTCDEMPKSRILVLKFKKEDEEEMSLWYLDSPTFCNCEVYKERNNVF